MSASFHVDATAERDYISTRIALRFQTNVLTPTLPGSTVCFSHYSSREWKNHVVELGALTVPCSDLFFLYTISIRSRVSLVGIATGWTAGVRFPAGSWFFSYPQRPDRLWGPPSLSNGYWMRSPKGKSGRDVKLTTHFHLVLRSLLFSWNRAKFTFTLLHQRTPTRDVNNVTISTPPITQQHNFHHLRKPTWHCITYIHLFKTKIEPQLFTHFTYFILFDFNIQHTNNRIFILDQFQI
jgi:hypothetical protein